MAEIMLTQTRGYCVTRGGGLFHFFCARVPGSAVVAVGETACARAVLDIAGVSYVKRKRLEQLEHDDFMAARRIV